LIKEIDIKGKADKMKRKLLQQKNREWIRFQQQVSILNRFEIVKSEKASKPGSWAGEKIGE
jgi:hypothetical protein